MKRALALLVGGVLIVGSALAAHAQAPTVSFGGQMRVYGFAFDNVTDFKNSENGLNRDSNSFYFQRCRERRQEGQGGLGPRGRRHRLG
jgi:hypothetical protein